MTSKLDESSALALDLNSISLTKEKPPKVSIPEISIYLVRYTDSTTSSYYREEDNDEATSLEDVDFSFSNISIRIINCTGSGIGL